MKIVFLGTPEFAIPSLEALIEADDIEVSLVISQPDKARSRGKVSPTPIKKYALSKGLDLISPPSINKQEIIDKISQLEPDFLVVIAFGQIIGKRILDCFKDRIINIHGSILPKYRGAAPIQRALYDGEKETGLSAMLIEKEMDAGDVLKIARCPIDEDEDLSSLTEKLSKISADLLLDTLRNFETYYENRQVQAPDLVTFAKKIEGSDGYLNFNQTLFMLKRQINTCKDRPGAYVEIENIRYKIKEASYLSDKDTEEERKDLQIGEIVEVSPQGIKIRALDGYLVIKEIQAPNKRAMPVRDFLNGNKIPNKILVDNVK